MDDSIIADLTNLYIKVARKHAGVFLKIWNEDGELRFHLSNNNKLQQQTSTPNNTNRHRVDPRTMQRAGIFQISETEDSPKADSQTHFFNSLIQPECQLSTVHMSKAAPTINPLVLPEQNPDDYHTDENPDAKVTSMTEASVRLTTSTTITLMTTSATRR